MGHLSSDEDQPQDIGRYRPRRAHRLPEYLKEYMLESQSEDDSD
jgi:hypothetical protein